VIALEKRDERVLGEIAVTARLPMGFERLRLYFTDQRIIVGHSSKVGAGSVGPTFMLGSIGSALGGLFGRKGSRPKAASGGYPSPGKVLASHSDNFSIMFDEIVSVDITRESYKNTIAILSKNDKFDFICQSRFDLLVSLFEAGLRDKLRVHKAV
jgi:hypothetical protein